MKEELDKYEIEDCHKMVDEYVSTDDPSAAIILNDRLKINECFYYFKTLLQKGGGRPVLGNNSIIPNGSEIVPQEKGGEVGGGGGSDPRAA